MPLCRLQRGQVQLHSSPSPSWAVGSSEVRIPFPPEEDKHWNCGHPVSLGCAADAKAWQALDPGGILMAQPALPQPASPGQSLLHPSASSQEDGHALELVSGWFPCSSLLEEYGDFWPALQNQMISVGPFQLNYSEIAYSEIVLIFVRSNCFLLSPILL